MATSYLTGALPIERRMIWAAVEPAAFDVAGVLSRSRALAGLSPFKSQDEALAALGAAGCVGV